MKSYLVAIIILASVFSTSLASAARRSRGSEESQSNLTWDLGAAAGSYGNYSYSEFDFGLNDRFAESFNWRNVLWDRFGSASVISALGLDSSVRYELNDRSEAGSSGFRFFMGPGVRVASSQYSGVFAEAGAVFRLGGLNLGGGVKALNYFSPGKDPATGLTLPSSDLMIFIILSGGGAF